MRISRNMKVNLHPESPLKCSSKSTRFDLAMFARNLVWNLFRFNFTLMTEAMTTSITTLKFLCILFESLKFIARTRHVDWLKIWLRNHHYLDLFKVKDQNESLQNHPFCSIFCSFFRVVLTLISWLRQDWDYSSFSSNRGGNLWEGDEFPIFKSKIYVILIIIKNNQVWSITFLAIDSLCVLNRKILSTVLWSDLWKQS